MKLEFNESQLKNLVVFLDRIEFKGLQEVQAINEIINVINNPVKDESDKE